MFKSNKHFIGFRHQSRSKTRKIQHSHAMYTFDSETCLKSTNRSTHKQNGCIWFEQALIFSPLFVMVFLFLFLRWTQNTSNTRHNNNNSNENPGKRCTLFSFESVSLALSFNRPTIGISLEFVRIYILVTHTIHAMRVHIPMHIECASRTTPN